MTTPKPVVAAVSDVEAVVERDRWDRPLIIPPDGGEPVPYTRVTTVAETIDDKTGLARWQQREVVRGLSRRPDLVLSARTATDRELYRVADEAMEAAGSSAAARNGTTMHALTARIDQGLDIEEAGLPANVRAMLDAYRKATERFVVLGAEQFIVQDKIKAAGTYDRRLLDTATGTVHLGDLKTGQKIEYLGLKTCQQVGIYAAGTHYETDGTRSEIGADRNRGLLIWLPYTEDPSEAFCEVRWLDLRAGREAVKLSLAVRRARALKPRDLMPVLQDFPAAVS
jgi:hypothetical protein